MYIGGGILGTILLIALIVYVVRRVWDVSKPCRQHASGRHAL